MSLPAVTVVTLLVIVALGLVVRALRRDARPGGKWSSAGGVVVDARGRVALIRQRDRRGRWRWTLPKGRIDPGETAATAAVREVYEESGLRASIVRPIGLHEGSLHFTYFFEMTLQQADGLPERGTRAVRLVSVAKATRLLRSGRDLRVLRRWLELRTGVASGSSREPSPPVAAGDDRPLTRR